MRRNFLLLFKVFVIVFLAFSCKKNDIKKIEVDNQFAISLFSDTIKISDLLNNMDSLSSQYIKVKEDGSIYAYFADSINNAVVAQDILGNIDDVTFETQNEFELPTVPPSPEPITFDIPLDDILSIPFQYDGYEINNVIMKSGKISLDLSSNLNMVNELSLSTANIILSDGSTYDVKIDLDDNGSQYIELDLSGCEISPKDGSIVFSIMLSITISDEGIGGLYYIDLSGSIADIEFESIDGSIQGIGFEFIGTQGFDLNIPNLYGDLSVATPDFAIKYVNSFGFDAEGYIDSLYLTDAMNNKIGLIKDWNIVELLLHSTGDGYDSITNLDDYLVDKIDLLHDYDSITFNGYIELGCDDMADNMISDDSHIDIIADLSLPLEFNIDNLNFIDTLDFNLDLSSDEEDGFHVEDVFDELEFKFVFENKLPLQIKPQVYMMENGHIIDSLFDGTSYIHGCFDGIIVEDVIIVKLSCDRLENIQIADQLLLDLGFSSHSNNVVINANDYFNLKIGLKTKTSEIFLDDLDF